MRPGGLALAVVTALALAGSATAVAAAPKLTVPRAKLEAAFRCPIDPRNATRTPLMFVTGTGATGDQGYLIGQDAFEAYGHPVCYVNFPTSPPPTSRPRWSTWCTRCARSSSSGAQGRRVRHQPGRAASALRAHLLARPPAQGERCAGSGGHAARHEHLPRLLAHVTVRPRELAAGTRLEAPRRPQRSAGRDTGRRVLHHRPRSTDETVQPAGRPAADLGARGRPQHPDPGRLSGPPDDSHRHGRRLGLVRGVRGRDPAPRARRKGAAKVSRLPDDVCDHPYASGLDEAQTTFSVVRAD